MNNKIFKKKSSFYLFGALAFLLILACVGGFFTFNTLAADPEVAQGYIKITGSAPEGVIIKNEKGQQILANSDNSITVGKDEFAEFFLSFDDHHMGDENAFTLTASGNYYSNSGGKLNDITLSSFTIIKDSNNPTHFSLKITNWDTTNGNYYAKVTVTFTNSNIVAANKVTLTSIASDYGWVGANEIFGVYEKADENYKKNIKDFFKVPQNSEKLTFYVKPTDTFEDNLGRMSFSATHKATIKENEKEKEITLNYDVDKGNNIVNEKYQEVTLKLFSVDGKGNKIKKEVEAAYKDGAFTGKNGVIYTYMGMLNNKYKDNYGATYDYNIINKTFTGKDGVVYTYDAGKEVFKYKSDEEKGITGDLTLNLTASNITCNKSRTITVNEAKDTSGNTVDLNNSSNVNVKIAVPGKPLESGKSPEYSSNLMLVKNDDGTTYRIVDTSKSESTSVECEYDKKENRFVYTDADGNKITYKFVEKYFQDNDGVIYAYDETNKTFTGKDGVIYTYNETNKKFQDNYGATYAYDETNKTFTGKDGVIYTYNETNKKFQDNYGMTYDYYETNKTFTGKDGVIYTYDETNKKFKDNDGTTYDYDETNKTFTGKDGVIYTYDETNKKFKDNDGTAYDYSNGTFTGKDGIEFVYYENSSKLSYKKYTAYENVLVPYGGSVYINVTPTETGWYKGSNIKLDGSVEAIINNEEVIYYVIKNVINDDKIINVSGFELQNLNFSVDFSSANEGTNERVTISVKKITGKDSDNNDVLGNEIKESDGKYSGITPLGFVCRVSAGSTSVDYRDIDLSSLKNTFSGVGEGKISINEGTDNGNPYKDFKVTGLSDDVTLSILEVLYKTINVSFHEPVSSTDGTPGNIINNEDDNKKANIYLKDSTAKVTSFSSGQSWSFDLKFDDKYESDVDEDNKYTLEASVYGRGECPYNETDKTFTGKDGVIYTYDETNKKFKGSDGKTYNYNETEKSFVDKDGVKYSYYSEETTKKFIFEFNIAITRKEKDKTGRAFTFEVPKDVRGPSEVAIVIKNIILRKMPIQFKINSDMASKNKDGSKYTLNDFTISYISQYKNENGSYLPDVTIGENGIYSYDKTDKTKWTNLKSEDWSSIIGDTDNDILSSVNKIVPYNGILVFRITLNDKSKIKYILNDKLLVSANGVVEIKVIDPEDGSSKKKEDYCSCIQVVVKGSANSGITEAMTGKAGSISIGDFESSSKEVSFKFSNLDGVEYDINNSENKTHAGNILEKMSVYRIDNEYFNTLTENELYPSRILYECTRKDDGTVENTKNSYMLNYKKEKNTIAVRAQQGIDVKNIECYVRNIGGGDERIEDSYLRTINLSEDNNGYIVVIQIPDDKVGVNTPDGLKIEIKGIDIVKYNISLEDFGDVGLERRLSSESEFKELADDERTFKVDYGEDFEIKIKGQAKHSSEGLFNRITLRSGALFLKEGTQSGGAALEKNSDGSFTYIFFVYKVKSDSAIEFSNVVNKVILDFDNIDGMEFYECSGNQVAEDKKIQGKISCEYGYKYQFAVKASTGYHLETFKLRATVEGSEAIEEGSNEFSNMFDIDTTTNANYKIYTIVNKDKDKNETGVQKSMTISGNINKEIKTVTFEPAKKDSTVDSSVEPVLSYLNEQGDEISSLSADYGSNIAFAIKLSDRYSNSNLTVGLYKGDELVETLHKVSGYYKITNITDNYTVKVSGHSVNSYFVNFSKNDYVDYSLITDGEEKEMSDNVSVSYGGSCYFKIKEKEGYQMGESTVVQATSASGEKITLEKNSLGQYKLTNIKDNYTITVENIDEIFYSLKFIPIDGVTYYNEVGSVITGDFKVSYGKNFEFSIKIDDAHSESIQGAYIVTNESGQSEVKIQKLASDRYLIQNITQDITIRVANVNKNKYTITLTKDEGIDYYNKDGKVITGENEVEYGGSLSFKVNLYPLYANSNIKVMLGNQELSADDNEYYTVETVTENKTVTVVGIGKTDVAEVIETISSLPTDINDDTDLEQIIQAVRDYNNLSDAEKSSVGNHYVLEQLQKKVADIIHTYNGVTAEGIDWNIKLIANPIDTDLDACTRIYGKLSSEYILSLYDVYLWDTLTDRRYTLPEGKTIVIHLPTPNMAYFENPSGIHENSDGKLNFLTLNMGNSVTSLETSSLSPIGIVANRSIQPGRSSLIDAVDSNVSMLTNYTLGSIGGSGNKKESNFSGNKNNSSNSFDEGEALTGSSNSGTNKFRKTDNSTTRLGSALKLILIIMILLIIIAVIWALVKKYKDKSKKSHE